MPILPSTLRAGARDLPDVPPVVQYWIGVFLTPILAWFTTLVYRPLLRRCADHPPVLLAQWYGPAAVVAAYAGFHHAPDTLGRPPTFTIAQFVRAEIVRAWAGSCSDPDGEPGHADTDDGPYAGPPHTAPRAGLAARHARRAATRPPTA